MTRETPEKRQRARELRQAMTPAERALWYHLRDHRLSGWHFRRQVPMRGYIVDFYCAEARLIVEVDGSIHDTQGEYDANRDHVFAEDGLRTLRVTNDDVLLQMQPTLLRIRAGCATLGGLA